MDNGKPVPDPVVPEKLVRRRFTAEYKRRYLSRDSLLVRVPHCPMFQPVDLVDFIVLRFALALDDLLATIPEEG